MVRKLFIATLLLCGIASAQPPQPGSGMGFGGAHERFGHGMKAGGGVHGMLPPGRWWKDAEVSKAIGLNDGQVQKIEQIFQESRVKLIDVHASLQKEEVKLEPLLEADNPDESAVLNAIDRITAAHASLEKANAQMAFAIRRVLTPEQWKKLRAVRPSHDHFPPPICPPQAMHGKMHPMHPVPPVPPTPPTPDKQ
jgi:Spy/CpxP family protein refolding chaperone